MQKALKNPRVIQNMGWLDRVLHFSLGAVLLLVPLALIAMDIANDWYLYCLMLLSVLPISIAVWGLEPLYQVMGVKSCDTSERNRCGTFSEEIRSAFSRKLPH